MQVPRACSVLCALSLSAALLAGCGLRRGAPVSVTPIDAPQPESVSAPALETLRVAVTPGDTLNPYLSRAQTNRDLAALLYDPLVALDEAFRPQNRLARSVSLSGTACTVTLRAASFWDGSPVRAQDVLYSFELTRARDAAGIYQNVASAVSPQEGVVVFTLRAPDLWFQNLLTFPVIPEDSGGDSLPPGSGRYRPGEGEPPASLRWNEAHGGGEPGVKTVELVPVENSMELAAKLMSGLIDAVRLVPDSSPMETTGSFPIQTNQLVFLGFNASSGVCGEAAFRRAVDLLVDRAAIVGGPYHGRAVAAPAPVNPVFFTVGDSGGPDAARARELLDSLEEDPPPLRLLYNVESPLKRECAAMLIEQLALAGIAVEPAEAAFEEYRRRAAAGEYDLLLGETRLPEDMSLRTMRGWMGDAALAEDYAASRADEEAYRAFLQRFGDDPPFVPLVFGQQIVAHARNFYSPVVATSQDIFYNIHQW